MKGKGKVVVSEGKYKNNRRPEKSIPRHLRKVEGN